MKPDMALENKLMQLKLRKLQVKEILLDLLAVE
jgi:hypothetical protein